MSLERPPHTPNPPAIRFTEVSRHFGEVRAVDRVSFDILDGELFTLLGPSGSGKTTCLRLIGGFEHPTSGSIQLHGVEAAALPPWARDVNTVFQDYALFPHMTVVENVEYGLKIKKVEKKARRRRAEESLELVRLPGLGDRRPAELSGGQRQRVALARALVNRPRALLLDEPLGALDLKLRHEMQVELKALQAQVGITFVLVTHDQEEALSMSDRIAVFHRGRIEQIGTPHEVYEQPATAFVASFVGFTNLLSGTAAAALRGTSEPFSVRPEKLLLVDPVTPVGDDHLAADGVITASVYLGAHTRFVVTLERAKREDGSPVTLTVLEQNHDRPGHGPRARGQRVRVTWPKGQVQTLSAPAAESLGPAESLR